LTALGNVDKVRNTLAQAVEATKKADAEKQKAQQAHDSAADKLAKLQAAADSSAAALQAVGQDAELAAAVELFKNRLATVQPTVEPLQKTLAERNAAVQTATDNQSKAKEALLDAQSAATEVDVRYRVAADKVHQQRTNFEEATQQLARAELNVHYHKTLSKWNELSDLAVQLAKKLEQDRKDHEQIEVTLAGLVTARQVAERKMPEILAGAESLAGQLSAKKQLVESIAVNLKRVADAKTALAGTAELLKSPEKISPVLDELDATALGLRGDLSAAEGELTAAVSAKEAGQNELNQLKQTLAQLQEQVAASEKRRGEHKQQQAALEVELSTVRQQQANGAKSAAELISMRFLASRLRPLTPEQIGWSFLASTNVYKNYVDKHLAEIEKATPATPEQLQDVALMAARRADAVRKARAELQSNINHFISLYGAGPGQPQNDFFATPDQALYASNGGAVFSWAAASSQNVTSQVVAATSGSEAAEKLYLGVLSRKPSPTEVVAVEQYLDQQPDIRARLAQELVWGLMASAEFRFLP
jgi:chromosome segregation ATPase